MDTRFDQNKEFLQTRFPGVWEAYQSAVLPPSTVPDKFDFPLPNGQTLHLPLDPKAFVEEHQRTVSSLGNYSGAVVWGVSEPDEVELYRQAVPTGPFFYVESDPVAFGRVLRAVSLDKIFSDPRCRIAFANDCGQLMTEMAVAFGEEETFAARICPLIAPSLFIRFLTDDHPLGWFNSFILQNVFLNQCEEEKTRGSRMLREGAALKDVMPPAYLYQAMQRFLKLYAVASPGIRTYYREVVRADAAPLLPLSIVILAWNRWDLTERCLRSICAYPLPTDCEIIVVNNGSTDITQTALDRLAEKIPQLRPLHLSRNMGPAGGRDAAIKFARGKTFVFLDNDVEIKHERWLDILLEPLLHHPRVGLCGAFGVIHTNDETETWSQKILFPGIVAPVSWVSSFCVGMRRQALVECGGWRSDLYPLYGMEDVALGYALREAGWMSVVPGQFVPITHGMSHRDGHYDYDIAESGKKNLENFTRLWGQRRRLLNPAKGNQTLLGRPSRVPVSIS